MGKKLRIGKKLKIGIILVLLGILFAGCNYQIAIPQIAIPQNMVSQKAVPGSSDGGTERAQITKDFMKLMQDDAKLKNLMEKSIHLAAVNNPDRKTNPVRSLEDYYDFLDWSASCMPWNILDGQDVSDLYGSIDQSLDYFYYLLDQPLPELAGKGY